VQRTFHLPHAAAPEGVRPARLTHAPLRTASGVAIDSWMLPAPPGRPTIVYVHGSYADGMALSPEALALAPAGYGALLLDMPGCGGSGGDSTWGQDAEDAVTAGIDLVAPRGPVGVLGFSEGSSTAAHVARRDARVRAVVLAGAFTNGRDQLLYEYRSWGPVTGLPAVWASDAEGLAWDHLRTSDVVADIAPRPLLLVEGTNDGTVAPEMARTLFALAGAPKDLYMVEGGDHGDYLRVAGAAYVERLRRFFDQAFGP
jgi:pimeloyl-ACP methyl ester carboxylesterase